MEPMETKKKAMNYREYWQQQGGERFYTLARWIVLGLLFALSFTTSKSPLWPPSREPIVLSLWLYTGYSVLMSIFLFIPPLSRYLQFAFIGDILFIVLLSLFNEKAVLFLPFYFLPLVSASIRYKPLPSLIAGFITSIFYIVSVVWQKGFVSLDLSLGLQASMLFFIPWLISILTEQWSANNRRVIEDAERRRVFAENETQAYRERMHAFYAVLSTLAGTMDHKQVLSTALREIQKLVPYTVGMVLLSSGRPKELFVAAIEPSNPGDMDRKFAINEGAIGAMMRSSSIPRIIESINQESELESVVSLRSCQSACLVPLRIKLNTYGMLLIASDQSGVFNQEHLDMFQGISNSMIVALHSTQQTFDLKQGQGKLLVKEKEVRDRIASRIHDGPTQKVSQIAMQVDVIKQVMQKDPSMLPKELDKFAELAKVANAEMRMTLFELRPLTLETEGLRKAVLDYVEKLKLRSGATQVAVKAKGAVDNALSKESEGVIFDIIQECVNNALKHAQAQHIWIMLEIRNGTFVASVKDDGKGFDPVAARQSAAKRASFGLQNFNERAQMIDGTVEIDSAPGKGTTISVLAPCQPS